jgi:hypothetical protein
MEYEKNFGVPCHVVLNAREYRDLPVRTLHEFPIKLVHSGLAAKSRQLQVMIEAVRDTSHFELDMYLVEAPRQSRTLKRLKRISAQTKNVKIMDPVKSNELPDTLNRYDLSLAYIAPANFSLKYCMPNKLFDSIQARIGVVTGPSPDMRDFCFENRIGLSTSEFSAKDLRELLQSMDLSQINFLKQSSQECASQITASSEAIKLHTILLRLLC